MSINIHVACFQAESRLILHVKIIKLLIKSKYTMKTVKCTQNIVSPIKFSWTSGSEINSFALHSQACPDTYCQKYIIFLPIESLTTNGNISINCEFNYFYFFFKESMIMSKQIPSFFTQFYQLTCHFIHRSNTRALLLGNIHFY